MIVLMFRNMKRCMTRIMKWKRTYVVQYFQDIMHMIKNASMGSPSASTTLSLGRRIVSSLSAAMPATRRAAGSESISRPMAAAVLPLFVMAAVVSLLDSVRGVFGVSHFWPSIYVASSDQSPWDTRLRAHQLDTAVHASCMCMDIKYVAFVRIRGPRVPR